MAKFDLKNFAPKKASEVGIPRSILLFGPPKRGKSTCAASILDVPGYERTLVIDVEGGASAISEWYPEAEDAAVQADAIGTAREVLFGQMGLIQHLSAINVDISNDEFEAACDAIREEK